MTKYELEQLLSEMSLKEKLGQMTQLVPEFFGLDSTIELTGPISEMNICKEDLKYVGSTLNVFGAKKVKDLQTYQMASQPHHIPMLFMADVIHGHKTIFPIPLAISCSFNPENALLMSKISALEASVAGVQLTFAPMADLVRDPRWGRVMESFGEDSYLNQMMIQASVIGLQGEGMQEKNTIASCVKHFAAYGAAEGGRDYNIVDISRRMLHEIYLKGYKAAIENGAKMIMTSFNAIESVPAGTNNHLFQEVLRKQWEFTGTVISDYAAVEETILHGVASNGKMAAENYIRNCDIEMMSTNYLNFGEELLSEGKITIENIDAATMRILELKNELGLFENPYRDCDENKESLFLNHLEHKNISKKVAQESIVLLKNENILPLNKKDKIKIGLAGPFINTHDLVGSWVMEPNISVPKTVYQVMDEVFQNAEIVISGDRELPHLFVGDEDIDDCSLEVYEKLKNCDVILVGVGENQIDTGEAASKTNLRLTINQEKMIVKLKELGKPIIALIFSGRPLEIKPILPFCDAVLQCWFLGSSASEAIVDILSGDYNPSGKLSMSFPQSVGQIPVYYNRYSSGRPYKGINEKYVSRYLDCSNEPLFPFGYGLSYSKFQLSSYTVKVEHTHILAEAIIENISNISGQETVQLYIRDLCASVIRPIKELKAFQKVYLEQGQKQKVSFTINRDQLKFYNNDLEWVFEEGEFDIMIGTSSDNCLAQCVYF